MATRKGSVDNFRADPGNPTATELAAEKAEAERMEREEALYAAASQNATIVAASGISNGMAAHVVRERILAVAAPGGVK